MRKFYIITLFLRCGFAALTLLVFASVSPNIASADDAAEPAEPVPALENDNAKDAMEAEEADEDPIEDVEDVENNDEAEAMQIIRPGGMDMNKLRAVKLFSLRQQFAVRVLEIDQACTLNDKQRRKLTIAAKGVSRKALAQWEKEFKKLGMFNAFGGNPKLKKDDEEEIVINDADEVDTMTLNRVEGWGISRGLQDPLEHKFWKNILASTLNETQRSQWKQHCETREKALRKSQIDLFVLTTKIQLALDEKQTQAIRKLVQKERDDLEYLSKGTLIEGYIAFYVATKIDEKKLKKLLKPAQHQKWKMHMIPFKSMGAQMFEKPEADKEREAAEEELEQEQNEE